MPSATKQLKTCDRCGFDFRKSALKKQRGLMLCTDCYDTTLEIAPVNVKWGATRDNATTTTPVTTPAVFLVTDTVGISSVSQSQTYTREGTRRVFVMHVAGNASPTTVSAATQIVAGQNNDLLTLVGNSNSFPVSFYNGRGLDLIDTIKLEKGVAITLAYSTTDSLWHEVSRSYTGLEYPEYPQTLVVTNYYLLTESGDYLLLETGDYITLE